MKKTKLLSLLALSAVLAGCAEKLVEPDVKPEEKPGEEQVVEQQTITVSLPDDSEVESKVSIVAGEGKLILNWQKDDQVTIIGKTTETYKLSKGEGTKDAEFTGNKVEPAQDGTYTLIYPAVSSDEYDNTSYEGQTQTGNNSISHIRFNAKATSTTTCFAIDEVEMNGAIKFYMKLPTEIGNPTEIIVNSKPIFYAKNSASADKVGEIRLKLNNVTLGDDRILTAYMMIAPQTVKIEKDTFLKITVLGDNTDGKTYIKNIMPGANGAVTLQSGRVNVFQVNDQGWASFKLEGKGTEEEPYLINNLDDLKMMSASLVFGKTLYYQLNGDIDMASIDNWQPLNVGDLSRGIVFNGNGKTIKNFKSSQREYASFFGVLFGKCYNLTFEDPVVSNDKMNSSCGVVGGYVGTGGLPATVERVNIKGGSVTCTTDKGNVPVGAVAGNVNGGSQIIDCNVDGIAVNSSAAMTGGIAGRLRTAADQIANCTFKGTITTSNSVVGGIVGEVENASVITGCKTAGEIVKAGEKSGGIVGNYAGNDGLLEIERTVSGIKVTGSNYCGGFVGMQANSSSQIKITNSISSGDIDCTGQHIGGFVGEAKQNVTVKNCLTTGNIRGNQTVGGICGRANNASWSVSKANLNIVVEQCLVWSPAITALRRDGKDGGGSGIVCGFTSPYNTLKSCFHSSALVFEGSWPGDPTKDPVDQDDADAGHPLSKGTSATGAGGTYVYPYWGKTYDGTALSKAQELGWDPSVWDLTSGDVPVLK